MSGSSPTQGERITTLEDKVTALETAVGTVEANIATLTDTLTAPAAQPADRLAELESKVQSILERIGWV